MNVNEYERLFNITLKHKFKEMNSSFIACKSNGRTEQLKLVKTVAFQYCFFILCRDLSSGTVHPSGAPDFKLGSQSVVFCA
jgi:hypothetical protein